MNLITTLEANRIYEIKKNWCLFLNTEKALVENYFQWLSLKIHNQKKLLYGKGNLKFNTKSYDVELYYSPFFNFRHDRIYIRDKSIKYNDDIHLYKDLSLCLYHPVIDKPLLSGIPLYKMIPWITEWIVFYEKYREYGVWLGKEIKH
ncbi:hypothetical protein [Hyunsoonleella ulvae]|uniref:hypothetical protein n=1 Tax=Hyunsoonleella ulvae TaxID=2799948 RepID=UPI00193A83B1|nr:hypothetical protein [Hyunsoonleella ulvae]